MVSFAAERPDNDEVVQRVQDERNPIGDRLEGATAVAAAGKSTWLRVLLPAFVASK